MASDLEFFVEVFRGGKWGPPDQFAPQRRLEFPDAFTWMHRNGHHWLFFGDGSFFPFVAGCPPISSPSPLCQFIETQYWNAPDVSWQKQFKPHWIPYEALCVDLWDDPGSVLVESRVPQSHASHFGTGASEFPRTSLLAAGLVEADLIECWQSARATLRPINSNQGMWTDNSPYRWPDAQTMVTWKASIRELIGGVTTDAFRSLIQYGAVSELRVIALWR